MINGSHLASAVYEEAHFIAARTTVTAAPELTTDERLALDVKQWPLPSAPELAEVIEKTFWASLLVEEGRPCRPRLLYMPSTDDQRPIHWFEDAIPLNCEALRKLTPAQGPRGYLRWKHTPEGPIISGIQVHEGDGPPNLIIVG